MSEWLVITAEVLRIDRLIKIVIVSERPNPPTVRKIKGLITGFFKRYVELTETNTVLLGFKSNVQQNRPPINA